eukprot:UN1985
MLPEALQIPTREGVGEEPEFPGLHVHAKHEREGGSSCRKRWSGGGFTMAKNGDHYAFNNTVRGHIKLLNAAGSSVTRGGSSGPGGDVHREATATRNEVSTFASGLACSLSMFLSDSQGP